MIKHKWKEGDKVVHKSHGAGKVRFSCDIGVVVEFSDGNKSVAGEDLKELSAPNQSDPDWADIWDAGSE